MSKKSQKFNETKLDAYEQEIESNLPDSFENLKMVKNISSELAFSKKAASNYLQKKENVNIKLSSYDMEGVKRLAAREGIPYQMLISSIIHKYITHHL